MVQALPAILAVAGPVIQGVAGYQAGQHNKAVDEEQARDELATTTAQIERHRAGARQQIGEQAAAQWSNGFTGDSGSALDALRESQIQAALDTMELRRQGAAKARSLQEEGSQAATEGDFVLASGVLKGASAFVGQKTDWAQARSGSSGGGY